MIDNLPRCELAGRINLWSQENEKMFYPIHGNNAVLVLVRLRRAEETCQNYFGFRYGFGLRRHERSLHTARVRG